MTVELITGHAGSAHISAADDGWYNVGVVGSGKYVLDTGTQFACNVQSANAVTIGIGDALFEGRHVRVSATENVALDNGAQGMNRNDIICIKYEYNSSTSVESASLAVIKGTASSGTAVDPDIPSGSILEGATTAYMPLWRIPISGITVGEPVKLYGEVLTALDGALSRTWDVTQIPNLPASKTTSGTFDVARIPTLTAAKIPSLDASKIGSGTLPVSHGGTGKTSGTCYMVDNLYNNTSGTTGNVTLSSSAANYSYLEIFFKTNDEYGSVKVYSPNGKSACLQTCSYIGNYVYVKVRRVYINGTSLSNKAVDSSSTGFAYLNSSTTGASKTDVIWITRVDGYK